MKKTIDNLILVNVIFVTSLLISNVVTGKLVKTGLTFFGTEMILPGAMFCYAMTFLMTDVISEIWGKEQADKCVKFGFTAQLIALCLVQLTKFLPCVSNEIQAAYELTLGQGYLYVIGSLVAYYCSQHWDVFLFHKIREFVVSKCGNTKHKWIWNTFSTLTSQMLDTCIFITIAFGIGYGWLFTNIETLGLMIIGQYLFKAGLSILDTPFFYLLTKNSNISSKIIQKEVQND